MTTELSIEVAGLHKSFGAVAALRGIDFAAERGEVLAVLGPNGAGKTTTVGVLATLVTPDSGTARVAGHDVVSEAAAVRASIMLTGQHASLDETLTGYENLVMFARLMGLTKQAAKRRADELLGEFDLTDAADRRVGRYSGGMRRRIDIACGLVVPPQVVFLDEPTTGLDPRSRQVVWDLVAGFADQGITTLLTTQYLEEADVLSDRIVVVDHGTVVAEGTSAELKARTGASFCEVVPLHPHELAVVADVLQSMCANEIVVADTDRVSIPAPDGARTLTEVLRRLDDFDIELVDIALRRPSLDEVFLSLTGRPAVAAVAS
ncbi:MAG: daunorubicin/doxorubicin resistance ABC transporter ATP-binding protein DrrA [Rhodococcus sp. (in: high G+C Gram-positive bacteria)]|jgi:ABC-2 type transport system ATP-binding protein|uniref:daunorubicin/doxorubicin resistance ABC transporter ATP-binding protein DrrA n=1 Tax=Rhodococcus sp. EPR-157 TaxID=1813677 RepID=UPI0007BC05F7|nr:daunorubicin/doxorubicin resistance ABC transporter ATP-binding protein DrrA [Rhodococcus sp. EPR-157]KZF04691.1 IclR family transcriptional regulator [Rhodococcus sp. EPR-157]